VNKVHFFELRIDYSDEKGMECKLYEMPPQNGSSKKQHAQMLSKIGEQYLNFADGAVHQILKRNNYKPSMLNARRKAPFKLKEEDGIKLDLTFKAISGLKKRSRIEDIILGITHMAREESYYWHGILIRDENNGQNNGLKALRMLLGGE
jgi:hypothetical protein